IVMPRSRSISIVSSTCSRISRASSPPQAWISRSASVDLPWSICAMIAKLRIWLSGVMDAEHRVGPAADQREAREWSQIRDRYSQGTRGGGESIVVAGEFDRFALTAEIFARRKV